MKLCAVSFKECWRDETGRWMSDGGFPLQMGAIGSLFDDMTLLVVGTEPRNGGIRLPQLAHVVPMRKPAGRDCRRKLSVLAHLPYYLHTIGRHALRADVIHVPLPGDIPFLAMSLAILFRKRLVARYGSSWQRTSETTFMNMVTQRIMRTFAGNCSIMLATGAGTTPPNRNMHWIFATAISEEELRRVTPDLHREPNSPLQLAYVGRLSPEKGVIHLIEAIAFLRARTPSPSCSPTVTIIGDGPQREELAAASRRHGCEDTVRFCGQLDRSQLLRELLTTDVCVLPSLTESFCKARLDAMLCGVPVVTTDVGFGRAIIGDDGERGWIVPARDTRALAECLSQISGSQPDWPKLRGRCRQYVENRTLEVWTHRIGDICAERWNLQFRDGRLTS